MTVKPRVALLSAFLSPHRSGAEACVEEVAMELAGRYQITIITARLRRSLPRRDTLRGRVPVWRVGLGCRFDKWFFPFLAPLAVLRLRPQIVHAVLESYAGAALIGCRVFTNAKTILTCQSTNTRFLVCFMHRMAHRVTAISSVLCQRAVRCGRHDTVLIPNGLRLADIPDAAKVDGRILFAGRLEPMKGVDVLLQAFAHLPAHAHLHIVGDGSLRRTLERQAAELGIAERVTFAGYIPTPQVYREFARSAVFCAPSRSEAFGNVLLEAQAAGCAVVATHVGGIPDIVEDGITGLLVPAEDVSALSTVLSTVLADATLRLSLGGAGQQHAQRYDWRLIAEKYAELYS